MPIFVAQILSIDLILNLGLNVEHMEIIIGNFLNKLFFILSSNWDEMCVTFETHRQKDRSFSMNLSKSNSSLNFILECAFTSIDPEFLFFLSYIVIISKTIYKIMSQEVLI